MILTVKRAATSTLILSSKLTEETLVTYRFHFHRLWFEASGSQKMRTRFFGTPVADVTEVEDRREPPREGGREAGRQGGREGG